MKYFSFSFENVLDKITYFTMNFFSVIAIVESFLMNSSSFYLNCPFYKVKFLSKWCFSPWLIYFIMTLKLNNFACQSVSMGGTSTLIGWSLSINYFFPVSFPPIPWHHWIEVLGAGGRGQVAGGQGAGGERARVGWFAQCAKQARNASARKGRFR